MSENIGKPSGDEGLFTEMFEVIEINVKPFLISFVIGVLSYFIFGFNFKFLILVLLAICVTYWLIKIGAVKNTTSFSVWFGFVVGFLAIKFLATVFFWLLVLALVTIFVWPMIFKKNND